MQETVTKVKHPLRLNVGFIAHQPVGSQRTFHFAYPTLWLETDLDLTDFSAQAKFSRTYQGLLTEVDIQTTTEVQCVRCLTTFHLPLNTAFTELYAFSSDSTTESELLLPEDGNVDLGPLAREFLILEIPISPLCREDCQGLCPVCGENLNSTACHHEVDDIDPRLNALKSLLED
jgi:uncharacterized protein